MGLLRSASTVFSVAASLLLGGCAEQLIREESAGQMRGGQYEKGLELLESGVKRYPESESLKSGLLQTRNEAMNRLIAEAAAQRGAGRLDEAAATLQRALPMDTGGKRVNALLSDLTIERRQRESLAEAEALVQAKRPQLALRTIADALKDNPRQAELLALQHRLEAESRRTQVRESRLGLGEVRPISLDFRDANLRTVLDVVTRNSGVNFIIDKDIRQDIRVTVLIRSARVEDAIDLLVSTHQLAKKVIDSKTILIYPNTPEKQKEHQEQVVRVFYLASAEAKGAAAFLKSMLRLKDPYVDERSNMLAIRDSMDNIELAERLIALYDTGEPEVLVDIEVIEITKARLTNLGVQFPDTVTLTPLLPAGAANWTLGAIGDIHLRDTKINTGTGGSLILNLKRQVGDFTTLANPSIRVRNKEKAKILVGDKVPIISTTSGTQGFVTDSVSFVDVGLKLDVEPTIYADDEVAIKLNVEVSSVTSQQTTKSGNSAPNIGTRSANTVLRLRDGETQILAGLMSRSERSSASRIPGLGDLPVAGRLFSSQLDQSDRTELVLAVTPHILRNVRRPDAAETELWVGTEASPRMRTVGGQLPAADAAAAGGAGGAGLRTTAAGPSPGSPVPAGIGAPAFPLAAVGAGTAAAGDTPARAIGMLAARWQAPTEVRVGEEFTATLQLDSSARLRGLPMLLRYPAKQLQLLDVEEGGYFRSDGGATSFTKSIEAAGGMARVGVLRNLASGVQGRGDVLRLRMKALAPGAADISLESADPVGVGDPLQPLALPQTARVGVK